MTPAWLTFWDIDGTLLTTARAGIFAWEDAVRDVTGTPGSFQTLSTAGLTDVEIARRVLRAVGVEPRDEIVTRLLRTYESLLPSRLPLRPGRVLPGVREVLSHLAGLHVPALLLTGNTKAAAWTKLTYYGLSSYFGDGAYAEDGVDRAGIAAHAVSVAEARHGAVARDRTIVIGDTPHDVACGRAIGARTIAIATGPHSLEELRSCAPWRAIPHLPDPGAFVRLLEEAAHDA
jgi:phosphoglycolate phosphatase-like HAD superfamily hydrolase